MRAGVIIKAQSPRAFWFRVFDNAENQVNVGTFVTLENYESKADGPILARVTRVIRHNYLVDDRVIAQLGSEDVINTFRDYGIDIQYIAQSTLARASIIGYRVGTRFSKPLKPPKPMDFVYLPTEPELGRMLRLSGDGVRLVIGNIRSLTIPAELDANKLVSHHCAILAATGGGKSWLAGVIIEELALRAEIPIIIIDPHGEYSAMQVPRSSTENAKYVSNLVRVYVPGKVDTTNLDEYFRNKYGVERRYARFGINPRSLSLRLMEGLLNHYYGLTDAQRRILEEAWQYMSISNNELTSMEEFLSDLEKNGGRVVRGYGNELALSTLMTKVRMLVENRPFFITRPGEFYGNEPIRLLEIKELMEYGIHVLDLSGLDLIDQQALVALVLNKVFTTSATRRNKPVFIVVEEAHNYAPSVGSSLSTSTLVKIAREGRKFGVGLCIISQRPSKVHPDVLSQCLTQVFKRIINPIDLKYVRNIVEFISDEDLWEVRVLNEDDALVTGLAVPMPLPIKVRDRLTEHGGVTPTLTPRGNITV
ncbi:ATP-binding protein [Vulcanisaeta souniana]|uniref:ATPase n=1 Tax=Vulcanisaeta souniana JCM 11219 TaxID=1293586 RepID=A0A830DYC3_9CREN|nr:ATP-binding protein [Vulcanisaeta souniana]BDR92008.1 ATPase [Vulcanisaeta souniana JCM 11219]GGI68619.1 ATPase [Vulcanisaeta souniana JCM 11219]